MSSFSAAAPRNPTAPVSLKQGKESPMNSVETVSEFAGGYLLLVANGAGPLSIDRRLAK